MSHYSPLESSISFPTSGDYGAGCMDESALTLCEEEPLKAEDIDQTLPGSWRQRRHNRTLIVCPSFVPSFEGLRGVAVILTQYGHIARTTSAHVNVTAGRTGVTIFFVLSGFLITGVLMHLQESYSKQNSKRLYSHLLRFYSDRSVRLYPALLLMVVVSLSYRLWLLRELPEGTIADTAIVLTYFEDLHPVFKTPIDFWGNTWSLAVEEQFYVFWSLLMPGIIRMNYRWRAIILLSLIFLSHANRSIAYFANIDTPKILFYPHGPISNWWKMLIGAGLRLVPLPKILTKRWLSWAGLLLLVWSHVFCALNLRINTTSCFWTARSYVDYKFLNEPVAAFASIAIVCGCCLHGNQLLEWAPLRFVGRVSYSFYLYQIPLLHAGGKKPRGMSGLGYTFLAFMAACASTFLVEEPLRNRYKKWRESISR